MRVRERPGRWLAVREEWQEVRHSTSARSGGYVVGYVIRRTPLGWLAGDCKRTALASAPFGTTAVLSFLSLDAGDRDGWLDMEMGATVECRVPLFERGAGRASLEGAVVRSAQLEMGVAA